MHTVIAFLFACLIPVWAASEVSIQPSASQVAVAQTFTVTLRLTGAPAIDSWQTNLRFDAARLELQAQAGGTIGVFVADSRTLTAINSSGEVRCGGFQLSASTAVDGDLAVLTFRAKAAGSATLQTPAYAADRPFGNRLHVRQPASWLVPGSGVDRVVQIGAGILRSIAIRARDALGATMPCDFSILPAGTMGTVGDDTVFSGLQPAQAHVITIERPPVGIN